MDMKLLRLKKLFIRAVVAHPCRCYSPNIKRYSGILTREEIMLNSRNSCRRVVAGAIGAGAVAGALLVGAAGPAQASPGEFAAPPAAVQVAGNQIALPAAPADSVFATDVHMAPMPQWWGHHWRHRLWHRWWWWW